MKYSIVFYFLLFWKIGLSAEHGKFVFYKGLIGKYPVEMTFYTSDSLKNISGFYRYLNSNAMLHIEGLFEDSVNFKFAEKVINSKTGKFHTTGFFSGKYLDDSLVGKWMCKNLQDTLDFKLSKSFGSFGANLVEGHVFSRHTSKNNSELGSCGQCTLDFLKINFNDSLAQEKINESIFQNLRPWEFKDDLKHPLVASYPDYKELAYDFTVNSRKAITISVSGFYYEWEGETELIWNGSGVVSLGFSEYDYLGGVHSNWNTFYHCYNLFTGSEISLDDIFASGYKKVLRKLLTDHTVDKEKLNPEFQDSIPLNNNFYLTPEGIGFYYNNYEIACFMSGATETFIPWMELNKWIDPQGPMAWVKK